MLLCASVATGGLAQVLPDTYVVGAPFLFDYVVPNGTDDAANSPWLSVYLNWGSSSCLEDASSCFLLTTQNNSGSISFTPDYYSAEHQRSVAQLSVPSGVSMRVDACFESEPGACNGYANLGELLVYQPIEFSEHSALTSVCLSRLSALSFVVRLCVCV